MKKKIIKDNYGKSFSTDLKKFIQHIEMYHKTGTSLHVEKDYYFTVNEKFRKKLKSMIKK